MLGSSLGMKGNALILNLFWVVSQLNQICLAFQVNWVQVIAKRNPSSAILQQSLSGDPQQSPPSASPHADMTANDVVAACMDALLKNDTPWENSGLEFCYDFSSDSCRAALGGSLEEYISFASDPTVAFSVLLNAKEYQVSSVGPIIAGSMTRGPMQTILVSVTPAKGLGRTYLWTVQQERRPPRQGLWLVNDCIFVENAFALTE